MHGDRASAAETREEAGLNMRKLHGAGARQAALLSAIGLERGENRALLQETEQLLRRAVQEELTDRQRSCLLLYYSGQHTIPEIAAQLGLTRGTVSKHIRKGINRLRHALMYSAFGAKFLA